MDFNAYWRATVNNRYAEDAIIYLLSGVADGVLFNEHA